MLKNFIVPLLLTVHSFIHLFNKYLSSLQCARLCSGCKGYKSDKTLVLQDIILHQAIDEQIKWDIC